MRDDFSQVIIRRSLLLRFNQVCNQAPVNIFKFLQICLGCWTVTVPRRFYCFKNKVSHACHGGNHHYYPVVLCRFANNGGTLTEPLRIPDGGTAKLHYDQTIPVHYYFSSFCKTAPSLSTSGTSSRVTPAPLLSAVVNVVSVCVPSRANNLCNSSATRISSLVVKAMTDEPDPLMATPSKPGSRKPRHCSIPGTSCWRYGWCSLSWNSSGKSLKFPEKQVAARIEVRCKVCSTSARSYFLGRTSRA